MKKIAAFLLMFCICLISCDDANNNETGTKNLLSDLTEIGEMSGADLVQFSYDKCFVPNEFTFIGEKVYASFVEFEDVYKKTGSKSNNLDSILLNILLTSIPPEYTSLSDKNFTETEDDIFEIIVTSLKSTESENVLYKIGCFEDLISRNNSVNTETKKRLLVFCSAYKYIFDYLYEKSQCKQAQSFDDCFRGKMDEIFNGSGIVRKLHCVIDWPLCLSVAAADCLIELA